MNNKIKKELIEWVKVFAFAIILAFILQMFVSPTIVRGLSMYPTLDNNNYLLINKIAYSSNLPQKGDIIVFESHLETENGKEKDLVKRVIGVEGDKVNIEDGEVYINDEKQEELYINGDYTDGYIDLTIPEGYVFVMGDNRPNSLDSRSEQVGLVNIKDDIIGKVFVRLFPFDKIRTFN